MFGKNVVMPLAFQIKEANDWINEKKK